MTWYWWMTNNGKAAHAADHTGTELDASPWTNEDGWQWQGDYPNEIFDVMQSEAVAAYQAGDINRALRILADAAFEDIDRGQP